MSDSVNREVMAPPPSAAAPPSRQEKRSKTRTAMKAIKADYLRKAKLAAKQAMKERVRAKATKEQKVKEYDREMTLADIANGRQPLKHRHGPSRRSLPDRSEPEQV